jgi:hypothetical protein
MTRTTPKGAPMPMGFDAGDEAIALSDDEAVFCA